MEVSRLVAKENKDLYNCMNVINFIDGSPHLKHKHLLNFYFKLSKEVFIASKKSNPFVLDLGAGEGTTTSCFLNLNAKVTAVDISQNQLNSLKEKCSMYGDNLKVICEDVNDTLKRSAKYDIVSINSFLHHIPDYCKLLKQVDSILDERGQIFTWQDPLRYDTLSKFNSLFSKVAYFSWRIFKGDVINGLKRRIRRSKNIYTNDRFDNTEYHVTRNGVDQDAIKSLLEEMGYNVILIKYFSTQSILWQHIGTWLGLKNTFGIIAQKL